MIQFRFLPGHSAIDCKIEGKWKTGENIDDKSDIFGNSIVDLNETETNGNDQVELSGNIGNVTWWTMCEGKWWQTEEFPLREREE